MTICEAKVVLLAACDEASLRDAIEALPDRSRLQQLDPLLRALVETRLAQLTETAP
jgi:hypothetical protein